MFKQSYLQPPRFILQRIWGLHFCNLFHWGQKENKPWKFSWKLTFNKGESQWWTPASCSLTDIMFKALCWDKTSFQLCHRLSLGKSLNLSSQPPSVKPWLFSLCFQSYLSGLQVLWCRDCLSLGVWPQTSTIGPPVSAGACMCCCDTNIANCTDNFKFTFTN